jgi:hypothetical protein
MSAHDGDGIENPVAPPPRRRSFLASRQDEILEIEIHPMETEEDGNTFPISKEEDDIPVLTEIIAVAEKELEVPVFEEIPPDSATASDLGIEELAARIAQAIDRQMAYELPTLIEAALLSVSEELRAGISSTVEAALRDFIAAHHKQP